MGGFAPVHDIGEVGRGRADVDDQRRLIEQLGRDLQLVRVAGIEKRGARFGHDVHVAKSRALHDLTVARAVVFLPACGAADGDVYVSVKEIVRLLQKRRAKAVGEALNVALRVHGVQITALEAGTQMHDLAVEQRLLADAHFRTGHADDGQDGAAPVNRLNYGFNYAVFRQTGDRALTVANVDANVLHSFVSSGVSSNCTMAMPRATSRSPFSTAGAMVRVARLVGMISKYASFVPSYSKNV